MDFVCERVASSRKEAAEAVEKLFDIIREDLQRGKKVKLSGFGNFVVSHKRARLGRNPQTGEPITIGSRDVLSFKPSQVLKRFVNRRAKPRS